jgi:hypothetical protein
MTDNLNDIDKAREKRRDRSGWTLDEIKKQAKSEIKTFQEMSKDEPPDLISGDMGKIIRGEDDIEDRNE